MNKLLSDGLWQELRRLDREQQPKSAAVAYVTSDRFVKFRKGDVLVVHASNGAIASGETDPEVLRRAFRRGAVVYSCPGLHAKVMVSGDTAVIGSANFSESSRESLIEAALVTDHPAAVAGARFFVSSLSEKCRRVTKAFLKHACSIERKTPSGRRPRRTRRQKRIAIREPQYWLTSVTELDDDSHPDEAEAAEAGFALAEGKKTRRTSDVSWIRFTGDCRFRRDARAGDVVIQIFFPFGSKRPSGVYRHVPILYRQEERTCTRFYVEEFANAERTLITWGQLFRLVRRVFGSSRINSRSTRRIRPEHAEALFTLWKKR